MKKFLTLLIAILMLISTAACTSGGRGGNSDPGSAAERGDIGTPAATEAPEPYVIDYYMLANTTSYEVDNIMNEINKIILPKFNSTVKITMITWDDWFTKVNSDIRAGEKVDIIFTADWWQYMNSIANGYLQPLDGLLDQYGAGAKALLGEAFITGCQVGGVLYGVPTNKELSACGGFVYNKTLLDKYGLEVDVNWKSFRDWEPLLEVIKENEPDVVPLITRDNWHHMNTSTNLPCELIWGPELDDADIAWIYDHPWYMDELRVARDFYNKGYIVENNLSDPIDEWVNMRIVQGNFFLVSEALKPGKGKSTELMASLVNPEIEYDEFETYPYMVRTLSCGGSMLAIPSTSGDPAKAMQFINEMHTNPDLTNLLAWGIEGRQYNVVSENPKRVQPIENDSWIGSVLVWTLGNQFNVYLSDIEPEDKYTLMAATKEGIPSHISNGYRFDVSEYQDKISLLENIMYGYRIPLRVGAVDPDATVAAMLKELEALGFQELKRDIIEDFDKWLAENR